MAIDAPFQKPQTESKPRADELIKRQALLVSGRRNIESYWQTLHDYYYIESADVNKTYAVGTELDSTQLWDATTLDCSDVFASGFMNYLTPPTSKWFRLRHRDPKLAQNKAVAHYLEDVADEVNSIINRSNFYDQMFPSYKSSGVFGTSLLFEEEDVHDDARFYNMPLKQVVFEEDARGRAMTYFIEFEYTSVQASTRWGIEALSDEMQKEVRENAPPKIHKFMLFIGRREMREIQKMDKKNLPIEAIWIDVEGRRVIEESGYHEFPAFVHRFDKRPFIPWGFSPAMKALPFARILNAAAKTNMRAMMKHTDPPIGLPHNAFIAPFNMNPRAVNYYKKDSMDSKGIFTFGNTGDLQAGQLAVEYYAKQVRSIMYSDVFLAFNNITKDMNNPEVMERINEKMTMLGPAVGRYLTEYLSPTIQRTIGIAARRGKLPDPPDELMQNPFYEIDFVGALAQAQRRSELNTLMTGLSMVGQMAQYAPDVMDKVDPDKVTDEVWSITGAPIRVLRDDGEISDIRQHRAEQMMQQQEMARIAGGAAVAKDAGAAASGFAKATQTK